MSTTTLSLVCLACVIAGVCSGCSRHVVRNGREAQFEGPWLVEINSGDIGYARTVMNMKVDDGAVKGWTREGAAGDILGWWKLFLAKMFTDFFANGALLNLRDGHLTPAGDGYHIDGVLVSAIGHMRLDGDVSGGRFVGELTQKGKLRGKMVGSKRESAGPLDDYPLLAGNALTLAEEKIYNHHVVEGKPWRQFREDILDLAGKAQDDPDIIFGFFTYAADLPFSHFFLYQKPDAARADLALPENAEEGEGNITLKVLSPQVAHLVIRSFEGTAASIDSVFDQVRQLGVENLIIDLRGNPGGNISAMAVASNIADTAYYGGVFVTNKWFKNHSAPPSVAEYPAFPLLTEENVDLLIKGIHEKEGVCLKVIPRSNVYRGKIFVLTDRATASSCEPLVYGIRQYKLGTVVGERTAGAMLNGEEFHINDNWYVTIPTAEYYAADGYRLDQVGVPADINVPSKDALGYVLENLIR